ncbi:hypothetical protein EDD18DRAFT_1107329 [Armillaria luteobubalina]|uniref:Uncharacterized protein n=1 Tax=Armillaria luteobubalina TaxID=153913 RepID=A0AA39Q124_9AGAR|nr:hypothetical protein EDD18DRAFT_1107329 [Armillaria luteobubalina]
MQRLFGVVGTVARLWGAKMVGMRLQWPFRSEGDEWEFWDDEEAYSIGRTTDRVGFGMVGAQWVLVGSVEKMGSMDVFPHSKNGGCTDVGSVGILGGAGDINVGREGGRQRQAGCYGSERVHIGIVSRRRVTAGLVEQTGLAVVFPHSKSGRCTDIESICVLGGVGDGNVGQGWGCWWWARWWGRTGGVGRILSVDSSCIDAQKGSFVGVVVGSSQSTTAHVLCPTNPLQSLCSSLPSSTRSSSVTCCTSVVRRVVGQVVVKGKERSGTATRSQFWLHGDYV